MSKEGVTGIEADMGNLNIAPASKDETSSTSVESPPDLTSDNRPTTDSPDEDDNRFYAGFCMYMSGWEIGQEAVMKALGITDVSDNRIVDSVYDLSHYVNPSEWDIRVGAYLKDADRKNLDVIDEYVIIADGDDTLEVLEARLHKWKEFPPELWRIHKWMKGPHVFKNSG